jgi:hypothetical protein
MATYPSGLVNFTSKANTVDTIDASHPNLIQDEVYAIEAAIGTNPATSTTGGTYASAATTYANVSARIANLEAGITTDVHTQYLKKVGDSDNVITAPNAGTTKGLIVKGGSSQSVSLQEWQNSGGTALAKVDQLGNATANSFVKTSGTSSQFLKADGSVDSNTYLTTGTASTSYQPKFSVNATAKTAAYTLATGDYETMIQMNGAFAFSLTTALSAAPVGTQIHFLALTAGVSVAETGVTLNATPGKKLRTAYSSATLICLGTNNWVLVGDLSA